MEKYYFNFDRLKLAKLMGLPGFEPGSSTPEAERMDQSTPQAPIS